MKPVVFIFFISLLFNNYIQAQFTGGGIIDSCFDLRNAVFTPKQIIIDHNISYAGSKAISDFYSTADGTNCSAGTGCDNSGASLIYDVLPVSVSLYPIWQQPITRIVPFSFRRFF